MVEAFGDITLEQAVRFIKEREPRTPAPEEGPLPAEKDPSLERLNTTQISAARVLSSEKAEEEKAAREALFEAERRGEVPTVVPSSLVVDHGDNSFELSPIDIEPNQNYPYLVEYIISGTGQSAVTIIKSVKLVVEEVMKS
jgi:hypothetical protein